MWTIREGEPPRRQDAKRGERLKLLWFRKPNPISLGGLAGLAALHLSFRDGLFSAMVLSSVIVPTGLLLSFADTH
jgi:hypothetical protein